MALAMGLTAILSGLVAVVSARQLGASGRGALALVITIVSISSIICSLGVNSAGRFHLVDPKTRMPFSHYLGLSVLLVAGVAVVSTTIAVFALPTAGVSVTGGSVTLLGCFAVSFLAAWLIREALVAYGDAVVSSLNNAVGTAVVLGVMCALVLGGAGSYRPFVGALAVGSGVEVALHLVRLNRLGHSVRPRYYADSSRILVRRGFASLGLTFGQSMTFRLDRYIIGVILGPAAVGVYSVAATLSELLRVVPTALGQVAFHSAASASLTPGVLQRARRLMLLAMVPALLAIAVFAPLIVELLFGSEFLPAVTPLRILLLGELAIMSFQIDSRALTGLGASVSAGLTGLLGLVAIVTADLVLIPAYGMVGAAWASVASYLVLGIAAGTFLRFAFRRRA